MLNITGNTIDDHELCHISSSVKRFVQESLDHNRRALKIQAFRQIVKTP